MKKIATAVVLLLAAMAGAAIATAPQALATAGTQLWVARYNGLTVGSNAASSVAVSPGGGSVFVTGYSFGGDSTSDDYATVGYSAATGAQLWVTRYNGPASGNSGNGEDIAQSVAVSPDGGTVFVTGYSEGAYSAFDYATVAYSAATGAQLWAARYDNSDNDYARSVTVSPDGSTVFVTGQSYGSTTVDDYATVAYSAATGAQLWASRYNGPANLSDSAFSAAASPDGSTVFVTGQSDGGTSSYDYATVAYSAATGTQLWARRYNGPANNADNARSVAVSPGGGAVYVTGGSYGGTTTGDDYATVAYNSATGATLWVRRHNDSANGADQAYAVAVSPGGGKVFVTGNSFGSASGTDYGTVAYSATTGSTLWVKRYNGPANGGDLARSVAVSPSGGTVYVTGKSYGGSSRGFDYATVAYSAGTGTQLWARRYNGVGSGNDAARSVAVSPTTGAVFVTGASLVNAATGDEYATVACSG